MTGVTMLFGNCMKFFPIECKNFDASIRIILTRGQIELKII